MRRIAMLVCALGVGVIALFAVGATAHADDGGIGTDGTRVTGIEY